MRYLEFQKVRDQLFDGDSLRFWGAPDYEVNRWGIPDWRDPRPYEDTAGWDDHQWRWEFLRRHDRYRADFEAVAAAERTRIVWGPKNDLAMLAQGYGECVLEGNANLFTQKELNDPALWDSLAHHPDLPGCCIDSPLAERYSLPALWNPAIPDHKGLGPQFFGVAEFWDLNEFEIVDGRHVGDLEPDNDPERIQQFKFDLEKAIGPQIDEAKRSLTGLQKAYRELVRGADEEARPRNRRDLWPAYLRVIDAVADGASWGQVEALLPARVGSGARRQAAAQFWRQAKGVMDKVAGLSNNPD